MYALQELSPDEQTFSTSAAPGWAGPPPDELTSSTAAAPAARPAGALPLPYEWTPAGLPWRPGRCPPDEWTSSATAAPCLPLMPWQCPHDEPRCPPPAAAPGQPLRTG
jgi:hypothetical protein